MGLYQSSTVYENPIIAKSKKELPEGLDLSGSTALMIAVKNGDIDKVKYLFQNNIFNKETVNCRNRKCRSALYYAIKHNRFEIIQLLVEKGANIDLQTQYGETPLMQASKHGNPKVFRFLIEHGADLYLPDQFGNTMLTLTVQGETINILINHIDIRKKYLIGTLRSTGYFSIIPLDIIHILTEFLMFKPHVLNWTPARIPEFPIPIDWTL